MDANHSDAMTFNLKTLLYTFAVTAAGLAAFGGWGVLAAAAVILVRRNIRSIGQAIAECGAALMKINVVGWVSIAIAAVVALPFFTPAQRTGGRPSCIYHLKQLVLSVHNFHDVHDELPKPHFHRGANDDVHSWRIATLPFIDEGQRYESYSFDEPYNGPTNKLLLQQLSLFDCPLHGVGAETTYFAITGEQTAWGDGEVRTFADVTDGMATTILLIEDNTRGVAWSEPVDLTFDEAVELLIAKASPREPHHVRQDSYFVRPMKYRHVAMCDGSARYIPLGIDRDLAVALLTANGCEPVSLELLDELAAPRFDWGKIYAHLAFAVLAVLPVAGGKGSNYANQDSDCVSPTE